MSLISDIWRILHVWTLNLHKRFLSVYSPIFTRSQIFGDVKTGTVNNDNFLANEKCRIIPEKYVKEKLEKIIVEDGNTNTKSAFLYWETYLKCLTSRRIKIEG